MSDSFDDGDFTNNPTWVGSTNHFVVNTSNELQLYMEDAGDSYLSTPHNLSTLADKEWRFRVNYSFSPSNNNYGFTYLTATDADLSTQPDGIFFRIGENGSDDPIQLIERNNGIETTILTSSPGIVANSFNVRIKIIYRANGDWELYVDLAGGEAYQLDQTANHPTSILGNHIGVWLNYTVSNAKKFKYDDFYVGDIEVDLTPPSIDTLYAISNTEVDVLFTEGIDPVTGTELSNYTVAGLTGNPALITQDPENQALFHLMFSTTFEIGQPYLLAIENVADYEGNAMGLESKTFVYVEAQTPEYGDIIINEFFPDPTPIVGLSESQYIELYNRSDKYFNLQDWLVSDNNSSGHIDTETWLFPGEYLVLVPSSGMTDYPNATKVTSWAVLNISGDEIHLHTPDGLLVDELSYTTTWYKDEAKEDGGWSLERINPELPCSAVDNWRASIDPLGGTPGAQNSVFDTTPDEIAPTIVDIEINEGNTITLIFSEPVDSLSLLSAGFFSDFLTVDERIIEGPYPTQMSLVFVETLIPGHPYEFSLMYFTDCSGNQGEYSGAFIVPQTPESGDLIINEILFNPLTGGSDFVEIYNNSEKYIDIKDWQLANLDGDTIGNQKSVEQSYLINPHEYVVLTKDTNFQLMNYPFAIPGKFVQMASLPSYNNDFSTVYLLFQNEIMDEVAYDESWHFSLLNSYKGVSLERFSPDGPSNDSSNWHSASETVGFATPGRVNSQNIQPGNEGGTLNLSSKTFSPDNDGFEDALILTYTLTSPEMIGNMTVYDDKGRKIKTLMEQHLLGNEGMVKWEGTKDNGTKAAIGPYIISFEIFNLESTKVETILKTVTLAGKF